MAVCLMAGLGGIITGKAAGAEAAEAETPWYLEDGLSQERNKIIGIEDGERYLSGERLHFYAVGDGNNDSIASRRAVAYVPRSYKITWLDDTGERVERESRFEMGCMGTVPSFQPGEYTLEVSFDKRIKRGDQTIETAIKTINFQLVPEMPEEKETLTVEIDAFLTDDAYVEAADLIAKEMGRRLKIHGMIDNTEGRSDAGDRIDQMLENDEVDIAVGHTYCDECSLGAAWIQETAFSKTYLPQHLVYVRSDSDIAGLNDLAGKTICINNLDGGIWDRLWEELEGETVRCELLEDEIETLFYYQEIDAAVRSEYDAWGWPGENTDFRMLQETYLDNGYRVAVKEGNDQLLEKINQAIDVLVENGKLQEIIDHHFGW